MSWAELERHQGLEFQMATGSDAGHCSLSCSAGSHGTELLAPLNPVFCFITGEKAVKLEI